MIATWLLSVPILASAGEAIADANPSELAYQIPSGWRLKIDSTSGLVMLRPSTRHASATLLRAREFKGTADEWQSQLWAAMTAGLKIRGTPVQGRRKDFHTTWASFLNPDGVTESWLCLYGIVKNGRAGGVLFHADGESTFRASWTIANTLVDGSAFGPTTTRIPAGAKTPTNPPSSPTPVKPVVASAPAPSTPPKPVVAVQPVAPALAELTVPTPAGWTREQDPKTKVIFLKPPQARSISDAGMVIFPSVAASMPAAQFHEQTLQTALRGCRLLEPVVPGISGGFQRTTARCTSPVRTEVLMAVYTVRWGDRSQYVLFATSGAELFRTYYAAADAVLAKVAVPSGARPSAPPIANGPAASAASPSVSSTVPAQAGGAPELQFNAPPGFYRGGTNNPVEYSSNEVNYTLCVYPFRPISGDVVAEFQRSLLRDWIDPRYREGQLAGAPVITRGAIPGATAAIYARFHEAQSGQVNERMRILVVAGNQAAIIDAFAPSAYAWQKAGTAVTAMMDSLRVGQRAASVAPTVGVSPDKAGVAGLYVGFKKKFMAYGMVDSTSHVNARHYYLLSANGRCYCAYDLPPGNGDWAHFDFDAAERADPDNSGRFTVQGGVVHLFMGGRQPRETLGTASGSNQLVIDSVNYQRER